jgi:hypothetical protein
MREACALQFNVGPSRDRSKRFAYRRRDNSLEFLAWRCAWGKGRYGPVKRVPLACALIRVADRVPRSQEIVRLLANPARGLGGGVRRPGLYPPKFEKFLPYGLDLSVSPV